MSERVNAPLAWRALTAEEDPAAGLVVTEAAEVPGGCLVRCRGAAGGLAFVPGVRLLAERVQAGWGDPHVRTLLVPAEPAVFSAGAYVPPPAEPRGGAEATPEATL